MGLNGISTSWREDLDALQFAPSAHDGVCVVHRLAFRQLVGFTPQKEDCLRYFTLHAASFQAAASAKIARVSVPQDGNFHLTSRDIRRQTGKTRTLLSGDRLIGGPVQELESDC